MPILSHLTSTIREPGISRKLTLAFVAVILVVSSTVPVTVQAFRTIASASTVAQDSSTTLRTVARFQRSLGDVRAAARDFADRQDPRSRSEMTSTLQEALDAARCTASPVRCERPHAAGEQLPAAEAAAWERVIAEAAAARNEFEADVDRVGAARAVAAFDRRLGNQVDAPAQELTERIAARGLDAQGRIRSSIYNSMTMLGLVLVAAILVSLLLAATITRRVTRRLERLRSVTHRLSHGDLTARVDDRHVKRDDEIGDLISDVNLMARGLQQRDAENRTLQQQLQIQLEKEQERATRDPLTGLRNHSYFQDTLNTEIERCRRSGGNVTIAVLDLDDFKQVNDRFGHSEGDAVLLRATKGISDNLRPYDLACRLGGEEFGVIFPEANAVEAKQVLDRIADHIRPFGPNGERLTFSCGVTTWPVHAENPVELYQRADEAAYAAKLNGKANTVIYDAATVKEMGSNEHLATRSREAMLTTATTLVRAVDRKDPYTRNHAELVAIYCATIARAMHLDESTVKLVYRAGMLHDVGKIGIDESILVKGTQLEHDEWVQLRMHPEFSFRILQAADLEPIASWTRYHHEHFDGTGYPDQLVGDQIPLGSRIILVADAFESMTSDRVYRRSLGIEQALAELEAGAGRQFDPTVVATMVQLVRAGVFQQVMVQHGRLPDPAATDGTGGGATQLPEAA